MKDFYLTLLSNSSLDIYSRNTTSSFIVQLPHKIKLNKNWIVGLAELQFPFNFFTVSQGQNTFTYTNGTYSSTRSIREGFYANLTDLINEILKETTDLGKWLQIDWITNRVRVKITEEIKSAHPNSDDQTNILRKFKFHGRLALQLGFPPEEDVFNFDLSPYVGNVYFGIPEQIFVYCDLIEPQLIGYDSTQVIRTINTIQRKNYFGAARYQEFNEIHYVPVLKKEFDKVEIDFRDISGEFIPFRHGVSSVKLHFKELTE